MSLVDLAYEAVTRAIFDRRLEPGARLRIDALAAELETSITPVREALARTTASGLTRLDPNRGYTVTPLLDVVAFHQLFRARRTIESAALHGDEAVPAVWVRQLPEADIQSLRELVDRMTAAGHGATYPDYSRFSRLDHALHLRLVQLAGNRFFVTAWESLHFHLHMSRLYSKDGVVDYDDAQAEHVAIVEAVSRRDPEAIWTACEAHMSGAENRLVSLAPRPGPAGAGSSLGPADGPPEVDRASS